ncbi:MAG: response regulator, partial [Tannerellaceae bacterium]|nr:response regulator [Tannerellaceae bacterium]
MMSRYGFILIGLFAATVYLTANENSILFNRLDVNNGLPSNEVSCIYKDKKGFLWFGTSSGLTRFDGYEFSTFRHEIDNSLFSEAYLSRITETQDANLWITYQDGKISVFNPRINRFYTVNEIDTEHLIQKVFHEKDGKLLYCSPANELCLYDYSSKEVCRYNVNSTAGAICDVYQKDCLLYVIHESGLLEIIDTNTNTCIMKNDYLLTNYSQTNAEMCKFNLFVDSDGEVWLYLNPENANGLFRFTPQSNVWTHYTRSSTLSLTSSLIRAVEEDSKGRIWIATDHGGVNLLDKSSNSITYLMNHPFDPRSISQNSVICLYRDNTGILWCGTYKNGVNYYHESIFKFESLRYPILEIGDAGINDFNCIYEDASGNLWIGTNGNGLLYYERATGKFRRYQNDPSNPSLSLSSNIVVCLTGDHKGNLWIGTYMGGLDCFDGKKFIHYTSGVPGKGLSNNSVYSLYMYDHILWIGTLGGGVNCLDLETMSWGYFSASDANNPLLSDNICSISKGIGNVLLIGTTLGVNLIDTRSLKITSFNGTRDGLTSFCDKAINTVYIDSRELMWIGSNNGLSVYDRANDKLYRIDKTNGLPDNAVMSMIEDGQNILWMGTKNGLMKVVPQYEEASKTFRFRCTVYYEDEGVQGRIFNRNSVCHTSTHELVLGSTTGLTIFNPLRIKYNDYPPDAIITGFLLQNNRILPGKEYNGDIILRDDISYIDNLVLEYDQRSFTLVISALNYFLPPKNMFSYKMEGFDKKWTIADSYGRNITYTNLPPGNYTFMVNAENNDGIDSPVPMMLRITIRPPFWLTLWAILIYIITGLLTVYFIIKTIIFVQKKKFKKDQERITARRLHEMDEMKLRFFTNVSHEFRTPLTLIMAPLEKLIKGETNPDKKDLLGLIHGNANQLLTLVNQLLDFRKIDVQGGGDLLLSSGDIVLFLRNIVYSFKDVSEQKNIHFSYSSEFPSLVMSFDTDKVFKIVSNLINNAFKFTPEGGKIAVSLRIDDKQNDEHMMLLVEVLDSGIGIAPEQTELIFNRFYQVPSTDKSTLAGTGIGLHICREYAKIHNGNITVKSEPGKGSTFCLSLPVKLENIHEIISSIDPPERIEPGQLVKRNNVEGRPQLLIVDDHAHFLKFMEQSLIDGYNVLTACDGIRAWEIILDELPDIVVTDWMMPIMDGFELCKQIKSDIRTSHIPVI